ncbi:hypothetical protein L486_04192 [Kwoniella mangroviensis CBS 10435]|uniref:RING-type domain-containing protein n=1 Tax=Kwoniella mangroviensis CBS 10435 TaxID=1331196 RepID=A0A1B9IRI5_9TREE|nr:hypothetical protein L486_04192 [Kwoniella mangroviensis CBS 10435]
MRPPLRSTRSPRSPPASPNSESRPKPTLADVAIAPRRRLRDGSSSSRGRSSRRNSVVSSTSSRASSTTSRPAGSGTGSGRVLDNIRRRGSRDMPNQIERSGSLPSNVTVYSESDGGSFVPSNSNSTSRESSLTPPPATEPQTSTTRHLSNSSSPNDARHQSQYQRRPPGNNQSILDVMDQYQSQSQNTLSLPNGDNASNRSRHMPPSSSSSSSSESSDGRRYTTEEKGKGRAIVPATTPIEIQSSPEESDDPQRDNSIQLIDSSPQKKRRRRSDSDVIVDSVKTDSNDRSKGVRGEEEKEVDEDDTLAGGYTCPVCFCPPSQAVMTPCGHILCAQCLHSSLLAAIGRNPNPYPDPMLNRPAGRGRNHHTNRNPQRTVSMHGMTGGPTKWTKDLLIDFWLYHLTQECEKSLKDAQIPQEEWEGIKAVQIPGADEVKVEQRLKCLWRVDESWVVEGECPVCRNPLPGGYGPYGTGIGGIIPLQARLSSTVTGPKRKR